MRNIQLYDSQLKAHKLGVASDAIQFFSLFNVQDKSTEAILMQNSTLHHKSNVAWKVDSIIQSCCQVLQFQLFCFFCCWRLAIATFLFLSSLVCFSFFSILSTLLYRMRLPNTAYHLVWYVHFCDVHASNSNCMKQNSLCHNRLILHILNKKFFVHREPRFYCCDTMRQNQYHYDNFP